MRGTDWIIVDTETDGIRAPIHVVEVCAQRMRGWEPCGEPFRVWLNHDVPIPREAFGVHGYDQAFLRANGAEPRAAHRAFAGYVGGLPLVAHNLSFDWDRCLVPEWGRLGVPAAGRRGFCSVMLSRRVLGNEVPRHGLGALRAHFGLNPEGRAHEALGDVQTTVELFREVFAPRLRAAGLEEFAAVMRFGQMPMHACRRRLAEGLFLATPEGVPAISPGSPRPGEGGRGERTPQGCQPASPPVTASVVPSAAGWHPCGVRPFAS